LSYGAAQIPYLLRYRSIISVASQRLELCTAAISARHHHPMVHWHWLSTG